MDSLGRVLLLPTIQIHVIRGCMNTQESPCMKYINPHTHTHKTTKINFLCNLDLLPYVIFLQHFTNLDTEWSHILHK